MWLQYNLRGPACLAFVVIMRQWPARVWSRDFSQPCRNANVPTAPWPCAPSSLPARGWTGTDKRWVSAQATTNVWLALVPTTSKALFSNTRLSETPAPLMAARPRAQWQIWSQNQQSRSESQASSATKSLKKTCLGTEPASSWDPVFSLSKEDGALGKKQTNKQKKVVKTKHVCHW